MARSHLADSSSSTESISQSADHRLLFYMASQRGTDRAHAITKAAVVFFNETSAASETSVNKIGQAGDFGGDRQHQIGSGHPLAFVAAAEETNERGGSALMQSEAYGTLHCSGSTCRSGQSPLSHK
jgi:hypothetical protein